MLNEKQGRLKELLEKNINSTERIGTAIAITGSWGVGKTYFWNKFLEEVTKKEIKDKKDFYYEASRVDYKSVFDCRKYAYISLFGIENLSDLKNAICTKLTINPYAKMDSSKLEFTQLFKNTVSQFRDMKVSQYGVSASAKILESLLFLQVKDAIICFDDFERMSNKLDIKDVMGLVNQLKLEKNCQIILILDEERAEGENKKKYAEYKEKLIDETIKITSVEPLIRENTKDIDEPLVDLMVKFADKLDMYNFRFFQKVIQLYRHFVGQLSKEVAYSTKKIILVRILQGYFIEDFGESRELQWEDFSLKSQVARHIKNASKTTIDELKSSQLNKIDKVSSLFSRDDLWIIEFKKWFEQKETVDIIKLHDLANSELISEKNNIIRSELDFLMDQWRNLEVDQNYCDCLFERSFESISFNNLENLDFHCFLLKKLGRNDLSKKLKNEVINWLNLSLQNDSQKTYDDAFHFGYVKDNLFHWYINRWKEKNPLAGLPSLFDTLKELILFGASNNKFNQILQSSTLNDWENFIFSQSSVDHELKEIHKGKIMTKILQQNIDTSLTPLIKQNIELILLAKIQASTDRFQQKNIEYVIENFKKEGLL